MAMHEADDEIRGGKGSRDERPMPDGVLGGDDE